MFDINPFCVRDLSNCVRVKIFLLCFMDDKEKEKFETDHHFGLKLTLAVSTIFILAYFIYPSGLTEIVSKINII